VVTVVETDAGEPVGYTQLLAPLEDPADLVQDDTLVLRAHRGHRLGAMLKVANLRQLERLPFSDMAARRWLHTWTAQGNAPMQAVNARFGFRRVGVDHELERVDPRVASRS
jgi:GNAT superfamily N-acetyltransferase